MASFEWNGRTLELRRTEYQYGSCKQLAVLAFDNSDWECSEASGCPYGVLTVNLDDPACEPLEGHDMLMQYIDVNNWPGIEALLEGCGWCEPTGYIQQSGFVSYPLYIFKASELEHV